MAMEKTGRLIVVEGLDGAGKATQAALLAERRRQAGEQVREVSFPNYQSDASAPIRMYLSGALGGPGEVNAYAASGFYAADRYISYLTDWKKDHCAGHTIIADRYTTSNAVHQTAKLPREGWDDYLDWLYDCEFCRMELPAPDAVLYLDLSPDASARLLDGRYAQDAEQKDIHEQDLAYQKACREAAHYAAARLGWMVIGCDDGVGGVLPREEIARRIDQALKNLGI